MLPYRCVSPQCAMPLCQSYTRFDACPVSCLRCMSPCSTPVLLLSLLSPGSRPVSAGSLCCKLVLALPDFKPTQASYSKHSDFRLPWPGEGNASLETDLSPMGDLLPLLEPTAKPLLGSALYNSTFTSTKREYLKSSTLLSVAGEAGATDVTSLQLSLDQGLRCDYLLRSVSICK